MWPIRSVATAQIGGSAALLDNFSHYPHIAHVWFIYMACSRQVPPRRLNRSSPEFDRFVRGSLSPLLVQEFVVGAGRPRAGAAPALRIDEHGAQQATGFNSASAGASENARHHLWFLSFVCRTEHFTHNYQGVSHAKWPKDIMSARQSRPAASFAARSKRWTSNAARPEPRNSQNAQRNYERYLALAHVEAQIGNKVGAENYYQYAEHYYRSMSPDSEGT
jgi:hypothetical protein